MRVSLVAIAGLALLTGCAAEIGRPPEGAAYGAAVGANIAAQTASMRSGAYLEEARARLAAQAPDTVNFAFGATALDRRARAALDEQADWILAHPGLLLRIAGHADLVGGERRNAGLGLARARVVARALVARGVAPERIETVETRGEAEPVIARQAPERINRRAVTEIAGLERGYVGDGLDGARANQAYDRYAADEVETPASATTDNVGVGGAGGGG
ncbi:MAG: OmpA family protein [Pikeienuella sp.]